MQYLFTYSSQANVGYGRIFNTFSPAGVENTFFQYNSSKGSTKVHSFKGFYAGEVQNRFSFGARFFDDSNFGIQNRLRNANGGERAWIEKWASGNPSAQIRQTISIDEIQRAHSLSEEEARAEGIDYWNDNLLPLGFVNDFGNATSTNGLSTTDVFTANVSGLITFGDDQAHLLLGLRFTDVEGLPAFAGGQAPEPFMGDDISEQVGFVYNFTENVAGFVNYATSYAGNRAVDPETGVNRPPQNGEAYEAGIKLDIYDGILAGSIGFFDIAKSNVLKSAFDPDFGETRNEVTNDVSSGVEVELFFTPTDNWQTTFAYTFMDAYADLPPTTFLPPLPL